MFRMSSLIIISESEQIIQHLGQFKQLFYSMCPWHNHAYFEGWKSGKVKDSAEDEMIMRLPKISNIFCHSWHGIHI